MKILKTITFALALLLLPAVSVDAQKRRSLNVTDTNAAIEGIRKVMRNTMYQGDNLQAFLDDLCAKKKNDPVLLAGIAKAFFYDSGVKDTTNAFVYINKALAVKPNYAPAYLLKGDILFLDEDTTSALACYNKAIQVDSTYIPAYDKVILINRFKDRDKTIALIKSIKNHVPNFPVNLKIADTYSNGPTFNDLQTAIEHYAIAETDSMKARDYQNEASLYMAVVASSGSTLDKYNNYLKMLEVSEKGLQKFPTSFELLNAALTGSTNAAAIGPAETKMELATKAVDFGERLFNVEGSDTLIKDKHYQLYGTGLMIKNNYDKAIVLFEKMLSDPKTSDENRSYAIGKIADAYTYLGEYDKAENVYEDYIKGLEQNGTLRYEHLQSYAGMYKTKAEELNGTEKAAALRKACDIYGQAAEKFMMYADYAYYNQWLILYNNEEILDPSGKMHYAVEPAKKLYNYLCAKSELSSTQAGWLKNISNYIGYYYLITMNNPKMAKPYWEKLYSLDPNNENAKNVLTKQYKMKL